MEPEIQERVPEGEPGTLAAGGQQAEEARESADEAAGQGGQYGGVYTGAMLDDRRQRDELMARKAKHDDEARAERERQAAEFDDRVMRYYDLAEAQMNRQAADQARLIDQGDTLIGLHARRAAAVESIAIQAQRIADAYLRASDGSVARPGGPSDPATTIAAIMQAAQAKGGAQVPGDGSPEPRFDSSGATHQYQMLRNQYEAARRELNEFLRAKGYPPVG